MSLFQKSVEKKYLNELDSALIDKKFAEFKAYFGNPERQENIRNSKEEQFQEGFLRELFVKILDYTLNPEPNFNLTTELKNVSDSKKADGAILRNENAIAVIELKSTDTTDLGKVESQAFGYKNHHPKCIYVITSNFEKLRFYIQNAVNHFEFDLFKLTKEEFSLLWLCLAKENLLSDLPLKIKESSLAQEENITKQLYSDYSKFRETLYLNLVKNNPELDKLTLFKKTQKLIDRFLFIFFAEDKQLLPANSIIQIIEKWKDDLDFGDTKPLYSLFKQYFHILNVGRPKSEKRQEIFAYNGGLFLTDEILENVKIDDEVLKEHTLKLSNYDFDTDVDVNILGHIFEHSLGEIENVQAEIKGEQVDVQKTKRKKDGIFYTPKYITKYIVENTVGKLCEEKRNELVIVDEEYAKGRKNRRKEIIKELDEKLKKYQEWLLSLTILDPACGSGAFLNQALEFLIEEHKKIDELRTQLLGGSLVFSDITTDILEKNIYGVDINEESVEIAKLSLWLRTARKGRKLNTLSNNIKCGNSLIDDPEIAGDKAFNWQNEFPEIFAKGGFDVVIGNPPYVSANNMSFSDREYFNNKSKYKTLKGKWDLYIPFVEKSLNLLKGNGFFSFIIPYGILNQPFGEELRKLILSDYKLFSIVDLHDIKIFAAATVPSCIPSIRKCAHNNNNVDILTLKGQSIELIHSIAIEKYNKTEQNMFRTENLSLFDDIIKKIRNVKNANKLENLVYVSTGAEIHGKEQREEDGNLISGHSKFDVLFDEFKEGLKPYIEGSAIEKSKSGRYSYPKVDYYLNYQVEIMRSPKFPELFDSEKLIIRRSSGLLGILAIFDDRKLYTSEKCIIAISKSSLPVFNKEFQENCSVDLKYILGILNSKLIDFYYKSVYGGFIDVYPNNLKSLIIPEYSIEEQTSLVELVNKILELNIQVQIKKSKFISLLKDNFEIEKITQKIESFYEFDFKGLLTEFNKMKIKLSLSQQTEWKEFFEQYKTEINQHQFEIAKTDKNIDKLVYELYDLSEEEIKIIEESV